MKNPRLPFRLLLTLVAVAVFATNATAQTLYLAHLNANGATSSPTGAMATTFETELARLTNGQWRVETFPEGQLGGERQIVDLVQRGVIQSAIISVTGIAKRYPLISVLSDPFRFRDLKDVYRVYDGPFGQHLIKDIEKKTGLTILGFGDTGGLFVLTNSKHPIRTPDDMVNLRIRTMSLEEHKTFIRSLGGAPVGIAWRELYTSLQNGLTDGQMNPPSIVASGRLYKVQRYLTVTNHLYTPYLWIANTDFFAALTPKNRKAIYASARAGVLASRRLASVSNALESLSDTMTIYYPTEKERRIFIETSRPAMKRFIQSSLGADGVSLLTLFRSNITAPK